MTTRDYIGFYLNGEFTKVTGSDVYLTLADYLRKVRHLSGTKVVCAEGDCGACTVLVARVQETLVKKIPTLNYKSANSCIQFLGLLDGSHVVTVEGIKNPQTKKLHPVQNSMLSCHGAQCGYCTPGFICAMTGLVEDVKNEKQKITLSRVKNHLTGNLCRCTGYEPIIESALQLDLNETPSLKEFYPQEEEMIRTLKKLIEISALVKFSGKNLQDEVVIKEFFLPSSLEEALLYKKNNPDARLVSGATDLGVLSNKGRVELIQKMSLNNVLSVHEMKKNETVIFLGAKVTLTETEKLLDADFPEFSRLLHIFASPQIKNQGTLVGNIANASPIGDTIPFLNVAEAKLIIEKWEGDKIQRREIKADDFIIGYKKLNLESSELVTAISLSKTESKFKLYKASLRKDLDISQVTFAARYNISFDQGTSRLIVHDLEIAFGGMSERVQRVKGLVDLLKNDFSQSSIDQVKALVATTFSPFSDVRATREYRLKVAQNFMQKFFDEITQSYIYVHHKNSSKNLEVRV